MAIARFPTGQAIAAVMAQPWLDLLVATVAGRHPALLDRLSDLRGASLRLEPVDLPVIFMVTFDGPHPRAQLATASSPAASAVIRAPLRVLLDIVEGRADGDGLFFERALSVTGDTGVIVALRNALDDAEIDFAAELASLAGPLAPILRPVLRTGLDFGRDAVVALARLLPLAEGTIGAGQGRHV